MYFLWQLANDSLGFICATCVYAALTTIGLFSRATSPTFLVTDFVVSPLDLTYLLFMRTMHLWCHHGKLSVLSARRRFFWETAVVAHVSLNPRYTSLTITWIFHAVCPCACLSACLHVCPLVCLFLNFPLSLLSASNLFSILYVVLSLSDIWTHARTHTHNKHPR